MAALNNAATRLRHGRRITPISSGRSGKNDLSPLRRPRPNRRDRGGPNARLTARSCATSVPAVSTSFDRVAEIYDATRGMPPEVSAVVTDGLLEIAASRRKPRFLEPGIGTGRIGLPIAARGHAYTGVDLSTGMLAQLRAKIAPDTPLTLVRGDTSKLPLADDSFDVALTCHVLHLVTDWRSALDEIRRTLKPGGIYLHCEGSGGRWSTPVYAEWQAIAERHDVALRQKRGADTAQVIACLRDHNAKMSVHCLAEWQSEIGVTETVRRIAARTFSNYWSIPDEVFDPMVTELHDWVAQNTAPDEMLHQDHSFTVTCARL